MPPDIAGPRRMPCMLRPLHRDPIPPAFHVGRTPVHNARTGAIYVRRLIHRVLVQRRRIRRVRSVE